MLGLELPLLYFLFLPWCHQILASDIIIIIIIIIKSSIWKRPWTCRKTVYRMNAYPSGNFTDKKSLLSRYRKTERIKFVSESKFFITNWCTRELFLSRNFDNSRMHGRNMEKKKIVSEIYRHGINLGTESSCTEFIYRLWNDTLCSLPTCLPLFTLLPVPRVFDPAIPHSFPLRFVLHGCYQTCSWASCLPTKCTIHFVHSTKDCVLFSPRHHFHIGSGTRLFTSTVRACSMQITVQHHVIWR